MSTVEQRLQDMGLRLPAVAAPVAAYVPAVVSGQHVFTSGQLPLVNGEVPVQGRVGNMEDPEVVDPEEAKGLAQIAGLNALAAIKAEIGDLDRITRIVKVTGYVSSMPDFFGQPGVINGVSELLAEAFQDAGQHARAAVGVAALPLNVPVEVDLIAEFR